MTGDDGIPTRLNLFTFSPDSGPAFEVWAPLEMQQRDAPESAGALVAEEADGFAPNLVVGHNRVSADMTLDALATRLESDAAALPGAKVQPARVVTGTAGLVHITSFTHAGQEGSGPLYQMTACLLAPAAGSNGDERDLIFLTGTCTVDQMTTWDPAFVDAATSVRFA
jgi:hypothetical protein